MDGIIDAMSKSTTSRKHSQDAANESQGTLSTDTVLSHFENSLNFHYRHGASPLIHPPHSMGWRVMPYALAAENDYPVALIINKRKIKTRGGEAIFVGQGVRHHVGHAGTRPGYSRNAHFNVTVFGSVDFLSFFEVPNVFRGAAAERMREINVRMAELSRKKPKDLADVVERKSLGFALVQLLVSHSRLLDLAGNKLLGIQRLLPVFESINENREGVITLDELAQRVHLSPSRFHALFKNLTGEAPLYYVQRKRLERAQKLLIQTDQSIQEVAASAGFSDPFHFSRLFKKRMGTSPSSYRETSREQLFGMAEG